MRSAAETSVSQKRTVTRLGLTALGVGLLSLSSHLTDGFHINNRVNAVLSGNVSGNLENDTADFPALEAQLIVHETLGGRLSELLTGINGMECSSMIGQLNHRRMKSREKKNDLQQEKNEAAAQAEYQKKLAKGEITKGDLQ